jgi:hypothetical protein
MTSRPTSFRAAKLARHKPSVIQAWPQLRPVRTAARTRHPRFINQFDTTSPKTPTHR